MGSVTRRAAAFGLGLILVLWPVAAPADASPSPSTGRVVVSDITIAVAGQPSVPAYLVRPAGRLVDHSRAGVLFLHWLGQVHSDRSEFLAEAVTLASRGAVSLLPQGVFPWQRAPTGTRHDLQLVKTQLAAFRSCLNTLEGYRFIDRGRVGLVGHDYGAMFGALLLPSGVHAAVLDTPDSTWGHWFVTYWLGYTGGRAGRYDHLFHSIQPVNGAAALGSHLLLQWAGRDIYIPAAVRTAYALAAPDARVEFYPDADHQLNTAAQLDRDAFLTRQLSLL